MPPLTCPPPPQVPEPGDCPLYQQRLTYGFDEPLRRAILTERPRPDLAALIRAEAKFSARCPIAALPPASEPVPSSILDQLHKEAQ